MTAEERIEELEGRIEALNARLPKHSVPPSMIIELEDLEDELAELKRGLRGHQDQGPRTGKPGPNASAPGAPEHP